MKNVKKRIVLYAIIVLVIALAISGVIYAQYANRAPTPAELLSLGEQYLLDLDCEQALVQFLKVIEIEPMNERAYLGAAEASIGLGQMSEAIAILERGLIALPDSAALTEMLETLQASPNIESEALETDTELTSESGVDSGTITINGIIISNIEHYNDAYAEYSAMYSPESVGIRSYGVIFSSPLSYSGELISEAALGYDHEKTTEIFGTWIERISDDGSIQENDQLIGVTLSLTGYFQFDEEHMEISKITDGRYTVDYFYEPNGPYTFEVVSAS